MILVIIEVADLVVLENFNHIDASFTWPHPTKQGFFVNSTFVRNGDGDPYLLYCPCVSNTIVINEDTFCENDLNWDSRGEIIRQISLREELHTEEDVYFYVIYLGKREPRKINKRDIEEIFDIQVVEE